MFDFLDRAAQRGLFLLEPETAHGLSIAALKSRVPLAVAPPDDPRLKVQVAGLDFPNPLGMAAGYDKNGEVPDALLGLGFGFAEVGTITPLPQVGNPKPRIFRLTSDGAVINRLGFNNQGHNAAYQRLAKRRGKGIVGVNIGANKDSADRFADYEAGVRRFASVASYLTVNISSPNTPGLRAMQTGPNLRELLERVRQAQAGLEGTARSTPIFLKVAPDLDDAELDDIAVEVERSGVAGVIVSNTTIARPALSDTATARETGGLSGAPLFDRSTIVLARLRQRVGPKRVLIGVGGVASTENALEKIRAGADLLQLYTGMIFGGPCLPGRIVRGLSAFTAAAGLASINDIRDTRVDAWAGKRAG